MDAENQQIKLEGNDVNEQVTNFIELLKNKTISTDALAEVVPLNADFINSLTEAIKHETDAGKDRYAESIHVINVILDSLKQVCEDGKITSEERKEVINAMKEIAHIMRDVECHHNDNEHWTKRLMLVLGAVVVLPVAILAAKND